MDSFYIAALEPDAHIAGTRELNKLHDFFHDMFGIRINGFMVYRLSNRRKPSDSIKP